MEGEKGRRETREWGEAPVEEGRERQAAEDLVQPSSHQGPIRFDPLAHVLAATLDLYPSNRCPLAQHAKKDKDLCST